MSRDATLSNVGFTYAGGAPSVVASLALAAVVCGGFVWSAQWDPLPATGWAAVFLFLAIEQDVRRLRIPNWLTYGSLVAALTYAAVAGGVDRLLQAAAGAGIALAVVFIPFALRWLGAGDAKAMMVLGALWGPDRVVPVLFWMFIAGGGMAIALVVLRGEGLDLCRRWGRSLWMTLSTRRVHYVPPAPGSAAGSGLPFAVAMGRRKRCDRRGMAMLEMVWVLPVLLVVMFAIAQFGLMFQRWITLSNAVREGARSLVVYREDCNAGAVSTVVRGRVETYAQAGGIDKSLLDIAIDGACDGSGTQGTVSASYDFALRIPEFGTDLIPDSIPLRYETRMRNE
jgi:prepilin peptidase CpaA